MILTTLTKALSQADFERFATISGDTNPIHVDPAFSARSAFGRPVAHGAFLCAILRTLAAPFHTDQTVATFDAMFPAPTFADEPMRFTVERIDPATLSLQCARVRDDEATCRATLRLGARSAARAPDTAASVSQQILTVGDGATLSRHVTREDCEALALLIEAGQTWDGAIDCIAAAMVSTLLGIRLPGPGTNYLKQEAQLFGRAEAGATLTAQVEIVRMRPDKGLVDLATHVWRADGDLMARGRALVQARDTGRMPQP